MRVGVKDSVTVKHDFSLLANGDRMEVYKLREVRGTTRRKECAIAGGKAGTIMSRRIEGCWKMQRSDDL
jgi:hypothetical protein